MLVQPHSASFRFSFERIILALTYTAFAVTTLLTNHLARLLAIVSVCGPPPCAVEEDYVKLIFK